MISHIYTCALSKAGEVPAYLPDQVPSLLGHHLQPLERYKYPLPPISLSSFFFLLSSTLRVHIALRGSC